MSLFQILNAYVAVAFTIQVAMGLMVIFGVMRVINMAHGEFFMVGAYVMVLAERMNWGFWIGVLAAPVLVAALALVVERVIVRPLYARGDLSTLLATFGLSIVLQQLAVLFFGLQPLSVRAPTSAMLSIGSISYPVYQLATATAALFCTAVVIYVFYRTRWGRDVRATTENADLASALGTNTRVAFSSTFALGAALAGISGALMAPFAGVTPMMGLPQTINSFLVVLTGGAGSLYGAVGGGIMIGGGRSVASVWLPGSIAQLLILAVAVAVLFIRPQGIFSKKRRLV